MEPSAGLISPLVHITRSEKKVALGVRLHEENSGKLTGTKDYMSCVDAVDESIGEMLKYLDESGQET